MTFYVYEPSLYIIQICRHYVVIYNNDSFHEVWLKGETKTC